VLIVHEFLSKSDPARGLRGTDEKKVAQNTDAWRAFSFALTGDTRGAEEGLAGPVLVPESERVPNDILAPDENVVPLVMEPRPA